MKSDKIGLLGTGYLGNEIIRMINPDKLAWQTHFNQLNQDQKVSSNFHFDWGNPETWESIPELAVTAVLTIPPFLKDPVSEQNRVITWGKWMKAHRPRINNLVYISTTGVYPNRDGIWSEDQVAEPDVDKGLIRKLTEQALEYHFNLRTIRSGAIYGPGQNIGERILAQKPVPQGDQPIHRIHVHDLAGLVLKAALESDFPKFINAVDRQPTSSKTVALWIKQQSFFNCETAINWKPGNFTRKDLAPHENRIISNQKLLNLNDFQLKYPTYREGMLQSFS
jgi:nucleoside-diphosphate-sugar epimerase